MKLTFSMTGRICLLLILVGGILASCAAPTLPPAPPVPTQDPATLVAQAAKTLSARITVEAALNPSDTPTPAPTATFTPTVTETPGPPTETPTPTNSPTPTATTPPPLSALFQYASTYPTYKLDYVPNEKFGLAFGFKNNGTIAWEPGYRLKIVNFQGEITVQEEVELGSHVEPGSKTEFNLWAFGSETLGKHVWVFQLFTSQGIAVPGGVGVFSYTSH